MKKLDGLRFLQENFPKLTVDCIFVDKVENLDEKALIKKEETEQIWRVRGGHKVGSELNMPQGSFRDIFSLKKYMKEQQRKDANMEFVIHSVSPKYFAAPFVGTLAVYNNHQNPGMRIELQKVTKELVDNIDKKGGKSLNKIAHSTTFCSGRYKRTAPLAAKQHSGRFSFRLWFCALRHGKEWL